MSLIRVTVRNGRIEPEEPIVLSEGMALFLFAPSPNEDLNVVGSEENDDFDDEWDTSPEGIAKRLAWYEAFRLDAPTDEEIAAREETDRKTEVWLRECDRYEAAKNLEEIKDLFP